MDDKTKTLLRMVFSFARANLDQIIEAFSDDGHDAFDDLLVRDDDGDVRDDLLDKQFERALHEIENQPSEVTYQLGRLDACIDTKPSRIFADADQYESYRNGFHHMSQRVAERVQIKSGYENEFPNHNP